MVPSAQHLTMARSGISENGHGALMIHSAQHLTTARSGISEKERNVWFLQSGSACSLEPL